jgi:hypothetical protein
MGVHGQGIALIANAQRNGNRWQRGSSQCGGERCKSKLFVEMHECLLLG